MPLYQEKSKFVGIPVDTVTNKDKDATKYRSVFIFICGCRVGHTEVSAFVVTLRPLNIKFNGVGEVHFMQ